MTDAFEMNVSAHVMLLLSRHGIKDARCLAIYRDAVVAAVRRQAAVEAHADLALVEPVLREQIDLLDAALYRRGQAWPVSDADTAPATAAAGQPDGETGVSGDAETPADASERARRPARSPSGYVPEAKSMEEKLKDEREPVQKLVTHDCVSLGLIDKAKAKELVFSMTGKTSQDAESDIVDHLREALHQQVKHFIRKARDCPLASPIAQEELRKDIHAARSVRSILMLTRQMLKEQREWQARNGRPGLLGMLGVGRRRAMRP